MAALSSVASTENTARTSLSLETCCAYLEEQRESGSGVVKGVLVGVLALSMVGVEGTGGAGDTFGMSFSGHSECMLCGLR